MSTKEFNWQTIDGIDVYGKYWTPENEIKAVICAVHGMGEHINRYETFAQKLNEHHFAFIGFDQRGHGKSEGQRGHAPNYDLLLHSIDDLINKAEEFFPETPKFLFGHSMGGNLVLNFALEKKPEIKGLIVSSPLLQLAFNPPAWKVTLGTWMRNIFPSLPQKSGLDVSAISNLKEEVERYKKDKLVHDAITPALFFALIEKGEYALQNAAHLNIPTLLYHGTADQLTSFEASKKFAETAQSNQVHFEAFENGYHETHHDRHREKLIDIIVNWTEKLLASKVKSEERFSSE